MARRCIVLAVVAVMLGGGGPAAAAGINQGKYDVPIDPGFSGLTARQILNRLLGNP